MIAMRLKRTLLLLMLSLLTMQGLAQVDTEFWFAVPKVTQGHGWGNQNNNPLQKFYFRFANMDRVNNITIDMPANPDFAPITVNNFQPYDAVTVDVTDIIQQIWITNPWDGINDDTKYKRGIRIRSDHDMTAYYEVGVPNNPDIFSLKGRNALGKDFFVPFQNRNNNGNYTPRPYSAIYIVATEDNTVVTITPTRPVHPNRPAGVPFTVTLNRGESVSIAPNLYEGTGMQAQNRLAGTRVESNNDIAITTSDDSVIEGSCRDLIGDQLIPTSIIGTEYIAMKGRLTRPEFFYVTATMDNTDIVINGGTVANLNAGEMYRHEMTNAQKRYHILTTEPSYVYHVAGFGCETGGAVLPPINVCTGSFRVAFTRSKGGNNGRFFLNILVRTGAEDGFILNNGEINTAIPANIFHPVPGTNQWLAAEIELDEATIPVGDPSFLRNTKDVFHLGIINGGTNTGTMYGYFSNFNEIEAGAGIGSIGQGADGIFMCHGASEMLVATDGVSHYWYPADYLDDPTSQNPIASPEESIVYNVVITGACQVTAEAQVAIYLIPPVNALFTIDEPTGCAPFEVSITNQSQNVNDFIWHFGDGNTSTTDNETFTYTYNNPGSVPVTYDLLLEGYLAFCVDSLQTQITVLPDIETTIEVPAHVIDNGMITGCSPFTIDFEHQTTNHQQLYWDFGDGNSSIEDNPTHTFENTGTTPIEYVVSLKASSEFGTDGACESTDFITIRVMPAISASFDFDPPAHCNPYPVQITNTSAGATRSYWNFLNGSDTLINAAQFTYLLENPGSETEHPIRLFIENDYGCNDEATQMVTVYPLLTAAFEPSEEVVCTPGQISFTNLSVGAASWHWDFDGAGSSLEEHPQDISFINHSSTEDKTWQITLTAQSAYGCQETVTLPVTAASRLEAGFSLESDALCSPHGSATLTLYNQSVGATQTQWAITNHTTQEEVVLHHATASFQHTFVNTSSEPETYTITQTVTNPRGCMAEKSRHITIYPRVTAVINNVDDSCHPLQATFSHSALNGSAYRWDFSDGSSHSGESVQKQFTNSSHTEVRNLRATLTVTSLHGCVHDTTITFHVFPKPLADFNVPHTQDCSPFTPQFRDQSVVSGGMAYLWKFGDNPATEHPPGDNQFTFHNPGMDMKMETIRLTVTNEMGCEHETERTIWVYPDITADFTIDQTDGCHPLEISITNQSEGASAAVPYHWSYGNGASTTEEETHQRSFSNFGHHEAKEYTLSLRAVSQYGCEETFQETITVFPKPIANFKVPEPTGCSPHTVSFEDMANGTELSYLWTFEEEETSQQTGNVQHTYQRHWDEATGIFDASLEVTNSFGCSHRFSRLITVYPAIEADFQVQSEGCHPLTIALTNQSNGAETFQWDFGDGNQAVSEHTTHTYFNTSHENIKQFQIDLTATSAFGCKSTQSESVTVYPTPQASFTTTVSEGCSPLEIGFENYSLGTGNEQYQWFIGGDLHHSTDINNKLFDNNSSNPDTIQVTLELTNEHNCQHSLSRQVVVYPNIEARFEVPEPQGCHPLEVSMINQSAGACGEHPYRWDYGNGTSLICDTVHSRVFRNTGHIEPKDFTVKLFTESSFGCKDSVTHKVTVYPVPLAAYHVEEAAGCSPFTPVFEDFSIGNDLQYTWTFEEGYTDHTPGTVNIHTYTRAHDQIPGTFTSNLLISNSWGCQHNHEQNITVYPDITADFSVVTEGCHPLEAAFTNMSLGADSYQWDFDDNTFSEAINPVRIFFNPSHQNNHEQQVTLEVGSVYGCQDRKEITIEIFPKPAPAFVSSVEEGCSPVSVDITNHSQGTGNESYLWTLGQQTFTQNSNISTLFTNDADQPDTLELHLGLENEFGCKATARSQLVVFPDIEADFSVMNPEGCHPLEAQILNHSSGASGAVPFHWQYGNGNSLTTEFEHTRTFENFDHNQPTEYTIQLTAESAWGCTSYTEGTVKVFPVPLAVFSADNPEGCSPHQVIFRDDSQGKDLQYYWIMGDGTTNNTAGHLTHTFTQSWQAEPEAFNNTLQVINTFGCEHSAEHIVTVYPDIKADFTANLEGCHPLEVFFENQSLGAIDHRWDFQNGNLSNTENPVHTFFNPSSVTVEEYPIQLLTTSQWGCKDSTEHTVTVFPIPDIDFSMENTKGCSPLTTIFQNLSTGANNLQWTIGNIQEQNQDNNFSKTHTNTTETADSILITLNGYNDWQCQAFTTDYVVVYPEVTASFRTTEEEYSGCNPLELHFVNESLLSESWIWDFDDGTLAQTENPQHTFYSQSADNTDYIVNLQAISRYGCEDVAQKSVRVFPAPVADFDASPHVQNYPERTVYLTNYSSEGEWEFHWDMGDGHQFSTHNRNSFSHNFPWTSGQYASRDFTIALRASSAHCQHEINQKVSIIAPFPIVGFSPSAQGCPPLEIQFFNETQYGTHFLWDFDDGTTSEDENPTHTFHHPGEYKVKLRITGEGGIDSTYQTITVFDPPVADFRVENPEVELPYGWAQFINLSANATSFLWEFSDGSTSTEPAPRHYFETEGVFDATLTVTNDTDPQCYDNISKTAVVTTRDMSCRIVFPNAFKPLPDGPSGGYYSINDPSNHIFHPLYDGVEEYKMEIFNRWGELMFVSDDISIGWDGYYRGALSPVGVYVYKVFARCATGKTYEITGDVTLLR